MLTCCPDIRQECQNRWQYLLIDEYQDTNRAQFMIASLLAGEDAPRIADSWRGDEPGEMPGSPHKRFVGRNLRRR